MPGSSTTLPISAVIATKNRPASLQKTLNTLYESTFLPAEIIIVDASENNTLEKIIDDIEEFDATNLCRVAAEMPGAATQRNQGVLLAKEPTVLFLDDDIFLDPDCLQRLYLALDSDPSLGGVSSMITNQPYELTGPLSRIIIRLLGGSGTRDDAGRLLAGIRNVLPAEGDDLPEIQPVEWLNTTCTLYRREALPSPAFPPHFRGASVCEDLALSLVVAQRGWKLANARLAKIFHDSQGGAHKADHGRLCEEEFTNRAYILRRILDKSSLIHILLLFLSSGFEATAGSFAERSPRLLLQRLGGILRGLRNSTLSRLPTHYAPGNATT